MLSNVYIFREKKTERKEAFQTLQAPHISGVEERVS